MELMVIPRQVELSSALWHSPSISKGGGKSACICMCSLSSQVFASRAGQQASLCVH